MKRILILTADYGYGHRSAANAIAQAMQTMYGDDCQVEVVNPMDDPRTPPFLRDGENGYDKMVREVPELYKLGYRASESRLAGLLLNSSWTLMMSNILRDLIRQKQPDVIVCTYLFYQGILSAVFAVENRHIPLVTVVTDLETIQSMWFHSVADVCLVPTQTAYDLAIQAGLPATKVKIVGIPVRPDLITENQDQVSVRSGLGWREDLFTVLAIGSKRVSHLYDSLSVLNHSGFPLQLIIAAGGDQELYQRCQETQWHVETHVYNFVSEMGTFMRGADCVLGKAGGLTVSESLACGLPLMLIDVIPGQETGNANYVLRGDAGVLANHPTEVLEAMCHWLENDRVLYNRQALNALRLGRPRAAFDTAELAWSLTISQEEELITL